MPATLFTWKLVVECSVSHVYLESQPCYSTDYQVVNIEAISASHFSHVRGYVSRRIHFWALGMSWF